MRLIKTFILRLITDNEQPDRICGSLQALTSRRIFSFRNSTELLHLLQYHANVKVEDIPLNSSRDENGPDESCPNQSNE